jgi:hypothetical protein
VSYHIWVNKNRPELMGSLFQGSIAEPTDHLSYQLGGMVAEPRCPIIFGLIRIGQNLWVTFSGVHSSAHRPLRGKFPFRWSGD